MTFPPVVVNWQNWQMPMAGLGTFSMMPALFTFQNNLPVSFGQGYAGFYYANTF